jgi:Uma2 family endonuclease
MDHAVEDQRTYTVEEFLEAYAGAEARYELVDGKVFRMPAETLRHVLVEARVFVALGRAVREAGVAAEVLPDGLALKIASDRAREPNILVFLDRGLGDRAMMVEEPVITVEVLPPWSVRTDTVHKRTEYFTFASLAHYLVVDPEQQSVVHCGRAGSEVVDTTLSSGTLRLDPPGISVDLADFWPDPTT